MYRLGWDERNGGNISYRLDKKEVAEYLNLDSVIRTISTGFDATELIGKIFTVMGTGKYFKNVTDDPENNLGIIRIAKDGTAAEKMKEFRLVVWGMHGIYGAEKTMDETFGVDCRKDFLNL